VEAALGVLCGVEEIARGIPAVENSASRFGNPAFRTFYDKVAEVNAILPNSLWVSYLINLGDLTITACYLAQPPSAVS
jgi:hypothetical protein